tara:strand:- start:1136 stop:2245 length:1110 start_codon:yes stop_codon:yes gene_type:complete
VPEISPTVPNDSILSIRITHNGTATNGSGVLFSDELHILTAAHLFNNYVSGQTIDIVSASGETLHDAEIFIHHGWDSNNTDFNHDLAIIKLSSRSNNTGLPLWEEQTYTGERFVLTGFGNNGSLHTGTNIFDGDAFLLNSIYDKQIVENTQVIYDYDNGLLQRNASKYLLNTNSTATPTSHETLSKAGDSGGGLLVNNQIAAISSYALRAPLYDINNISDSSVGELGIATLISPYRPWIEYITQGNNVYTAPDIVGDVNIEIPEPFSGSVINHFLLSTLSVRSESVILRYATRDGTATAGEDYRATQGSLELLPSQTYLSIPVTIYGDTVAEVNETFSMVLTDPTNRWLGTDVELIASHTIVNNDIFLV